MNLRLHCFSKEIAEIKTRIGQNPHCIALALNIFPCCLYPERNIYSNSPVSVSSKPPICQPRRMESPFPPSHFLIPDPNFPFGEPEPGRKPEMSITKEVQALKALERYEQSRRKSRELATQEKGKEKKKEMWVFAWNGLKLAERNLPSGPIPRESFFDDITTEQWGLVTRALARLILAKYSSGEKGQEYINQALQDLNTFRNIDPNDYFYAERSPFIFYNLACALEQLPPQTFPDLEDLLARWACYVSEKGYVHRPEFVAPYIFPTLAVTAKLFPNHPGVGAWKETAQVYFHRIYNPNEGYIDLTPKGTWGVKGEHQFPCVHYCSFYTLMLAKAKDAQPSWFLVKKVQESVFWTIIEYTHPKTGGFLPPDQFVTDPKQCPWPCRPYFPLSEGGYGYDNIGLSVPYGSITAALAAEALGFSGTDLLMGRIKNFPPIPLLDPQRERKPGLSSLFGCIFAARTATAADIFFKTASLK